MTLEVAGVARRVLFEVDGPRGFEFEFYSGPKRHRPPAPFAHHSSVNYIFICTCFYHHLPTHSQPGQRCTITFLTCEPKSIISSERNPVSLPGLHAFQSPTDFFDVLCRIVSKSFSTISQTPHVFVNWGWGSIRAAENRYHSRSVCCRGVLQRIAKVGLRLADPASKLPDCGQILSARHRTDSSWLCTYQSRTSRSNWSYQSPQVAVARRQIPRLPH